MPLEMYSCRKKKKRDIFFFYAFVLLVFRNVTRYVVKDFSLSMYLSVLSLTQNVIEVFYRREASYDS